MRPEGWEGKNPCINCFHDNRHLAGDLRADTFCDRCTRGDDYRLFEAGADAMYEGLRKTGYRIKAGESFGDEETGARTIMKVDGRVVFIED